MNGKSKGLLTVLPVMFGFFIMGFVDVAGIASSYVKQDFALSDTLANLLPMLAFFWFIVLSVPTGMLMGRIGRKNTALIALAVTITATVFPLISYDFTSILISFALMGIGNTMMQVSFNPLLTNVVPENKLTSSLTLGQFTRSIASFLGPLIAGAVAAYFGDWKIIFMIYSVVTLASVCWLYFTAIDREEAGKAIITFSSTLSLFRDARITALFFGILFFIGIDVGLNTSIPKFLMAQTGLGLDRAGLGTSLYFAARMIGSLAGAVLLLRLSAVKYLRWSMFVVVAAFTVLLFSTELWLLLGLIFILGLACANIFSIVLALALRHRPDRANEVTAIVLMGVAGGALTTPLMGLAADYAGQTAGMAVLSVCILYLLVLSCKLKA